MGGGGEHKTKMNLGRKGDSQQKFFHLGTKIGCQLILGNPYQLIFWGKEERERERNFVFYFLLSF